ncbi:cell wall-binding repeat-containing protein [Agromyces humatus]|uniref:Cell wall-binding repeat-containing protein n=1 Tax=Agromyces humatus TaxID=279573 RepID=A0ABP4X273_9MICO|nr:cell wall-binding repeat-containing protein [Agromyces humatus]
MPIEVTFGQVVGGRNVALQKGGSISGVVTSYDGIPLSNVSVHLGTGAYHDPRGYTLQAAWAGAITDAEGRYTARGLATANWSVSFQPREESPYRAESWSDKETFWSADGIQVVGERRVTGRNAQLTLENLNAPWGSVSRISGADRYSTAVAISKAQFSAGVPVAYVASGRNFPDALAAGPVATMSGGPVLLTEPSRLPSTVRAELVRLRPARIVVLGGTGTVGAEVARELAALTSGEVKRLAGSDRYLTSVAISKSQYVPGVPTVYLASGTGFPDALAGAPAAGVAGGPILLSGRDFLPKAVLDEMKRLRPERVVILGGDGAVSWAVETKLRTHFDRVYRESGADRFTTAVAVSDELLPGIAVAYIANGSSYPDALAAAPSAGLRSGPILLTSRDRLPDSVIAELKRLRPQHVVVLGGTGAVSSAVERQLDGLG